MWVPKKLMSNYNFVDISAGYKHSAAIDEEGI